MKNLQKIIANLEQENIGAKIAQKRDLGGPGARFGRGLGRVLGGVWRLWGPLRQFFGVIFSCLHLACFKKRSWRLLGSILVRV